MRTIPVIYRRRAYAALVDDDVYEWLSSYRWNDVTGYAARKENKRTVYMHREILGLATGDPRITHHINENKLDNRRENLAVFASKSEANCQPHPQRDAACRRAGRSGSDQRWAA